MDNWQKLNDIGYFDYLSGRYDVVGIAPAVIHSKISQFASKMVPGDNFIFYFSGHGVYLNTSKEYLLMGKYNDGSHVPLYKDELANWLEVLDDQGVNIWVIGLDACGGGGFWDGALENLKHIGLIASAGKGKDSYSDIIRGIGIFDITLSRDLI